ncbi:hypothetical protein FF124_01225 [Martelella lutilitoris]|uniref:IrrE N-terminal-like domain-containing protein n=1 Tax=Martelella lutilitoris TaxID=2583532 RepID=A0A5C4JWS5_9HYPH|nr:ImmA/IrrE family metallo-endopeptidase [Martelella lutilitoris]TNB49611.1 hypothetical protein FF124_01225 [Martelella lutilitoris]
MWNRFSFLYSASLFFWLLGSTAAHSQSCLLINDASGVPTPALHINNEFFFIEPAFEDYAFMLEDACGAWGMDIENGCNILPMMGAIHFNAVAAKCDGNKVIVYDRRLSSRLGYEGAQAVLAHELGHHVCNHLNDPNQEIYHGRLQELEADQFAGATLRRMGFQRESTSGFVELMSEQPTGFHPGKKDRVSALLRGWDDPASALQCRD